MLVGQMQRSSDDFDGRGFSGNGWPSVFTTSDGLDKLKQRLCAGKQHVSHRASLTQRFISTGGEGNKCGVCVRGWRDASVCLCVLVHNSACLLL